jgi:hypothetical protein
MRLVRLASLDRGRPSKTRRTLIANVSILVKGVTGSVAGGFAVAGPGWGDILPPGAEFIRPATPVIANLLVATGPGVREPQNRRVEIIIR